MVRIPTAGFGVLAVLLSWRFPAARWWVVAGLLLIIAEGIDSVVFFWPRNTVLFVEGAALHSVEMLRQTALEFQLWHWSRVALSAASAAVVFVGFLRFYRGIVSGQTVGEGERHAARSI